MRNKLSKTELIQLIDSNKQLLRKIISKDSKPRVSYSISYTFFGDRELKCGRSKHTPDNQVQVSNWHYSTSFKTNNLELTNELTNKKWYVIITAKLIRGIKQNIENVTWYF
jgi:hypothetical protein